jgi:predicted Zn-dependent peptidase
MPVEFNHATLDNGLTIIGETSDTAHTAAIGFFVRTGSRDELLPLMGVSHFLEHMMFKGTARRTAADVNRDFDRIGANYNASTSQENTVYYAHVLPEFMPEAVDLLSDMLRPALRDEDFTMEKNVILEEIGMYADKPFWVVYEQAMEEFFRDHPLGYRILGTTDSITALTRDQMHEYFAHRYSPDNMVVSIAGRADFDRCVKQIAASCEAWERTGAKRNGGHVKHAAVERSLKKATANMYYLVGVCPGPSAQDDSRYAAAVLSQMLGDAEGSRMYWKLIDTGLADDAELAHHPFDGVGTYMFYVSCDPAKAAEVEAILDGVLTAAGENLTEAEVQRAVSKIAMDLTLQNERPAGRMMALGGQWLYLNKYIPLAEELKRIQAVDVSEIRALIARFPFEPRTIVRMAPDKN